MDDHRPNEHDAVSEGILKTQRIEALESALAHNSVVDCFGILEDLHPADAADALEGLSRHALSDIAALLGREFPADVLIELRDEYREIVVENLSDRAVSEAVNELETDDAAVILDDMEEQRQSAVLQNLEEGDRHELERVMAFDDETAGRIMQRDFLAAPEFWTVGQTVDHARANADELPEFFFEIYVIDPKFRVVGCVPLHTIIRTSRDLPLSDVMEDNKVEIQEDMDQEEVAYLFQKYDLTSAPVIDASRRLTGMVTIDDVVDVIQEENREDLLQLSGVNTSESFDTVISSFRSRAPWLAVNVVTAFMASGVVSLFSETIDQYVALAILMPVVVMVCGNAGSQTLAVSVRGLAERELSGKAARRAIVREAFTACLNGLVFSFAVACIALFWFQDVRLSIVIGFAMLGTFLWAGLSGILIPLTLERMGADPAVSSSVFLLTTVDIIGFLSFLGLASLILL